MRLFVTVNDCYVGGQWDGLTLPEMGNIPVVYPHFRYIPWGELPQAEKSLALMAGWTDETVSGLCGHTGR